MQDVMGTIGDYDSGFYIGMISHYHKMKNKSVPFFRVPFFRFFPDIIPLKYLLPKI
jgi:hypothetical protein